MQKKYISRKNDFFDDNIDFYGNAKPHPYDICFLNFIKANQKPNTGLLDIGGGVGTFAKLVRNNCADIEITVIDPSKKLLDRIDDPGIHKSQGALPDQISLDTSFDYIHVKEVFHHITGSSIKVSKKLLEESLLTIKKHLNSDGFVLVHELFYESYLFPSLSRNMIFDLLAVQNMLKIKVPVSEFLIGLNVCFYARSEFKTILNSCGFRIVQYHEEYWKDTWKKRAALLKNWGIMLFILEMAE